MKILNFGSLNIDFTYLVDHIAIEGETISARERHIYCGGKGLNQTLAIARSGKNIWHAGAIGKSDGEILFNILKESNVKLDFLERIEETSSGHTIIQVDRNGQNCIVVFGGANQRITRKQINYTLKNFSENDFILLQNEINEGPYIMERAHAKGMKIVLNPSPFDNKINLLPLEYVDFFMVNEIEASKLIKSSSDEELLDNFVEKYPHSHIIMTVGHRGAYYAYKNLREHYGIFDVPRVDTTAAGDTFTGYFISAISENKSPLECLEFASAAASLAVSKTGASTSIPTKKEVTDFMQTALKNQ